MCAKCKVRPAYNYKDKHFQLCSFCGTENIMKLFNETDIHVRNLLDAGLEHASYAWKALTDEKGLVELDINRWPPTIEAKVGTSEYHLSAFIDYVDRAFQQLTSSSVS